jgi:hypothetical protein
MNVHTQKEKFLFFVKTFLKWQASLLVLFVVWVVSLSVCLGALLYFEEAWELANHSVSTQGSIVSLSRCTLVISSNNRPAVYGWQLTVQFSDANGIIALRYTGGNLRYNLAMPTALPTKGKGSDLSVTPLLS